MNLKIHPQAYANFTEKINSLSNLFVLKIQEHIDDKFQPENNNVQIINGSQIIGDSIHIETEDGTEISKSFLSEKGNVGLYELNFELYLKICEGVQNLDAFKYTISLETIKKEVFKWLIQKCKNETTQEPLEYLIQECQKFIKKCEIITPIAELFIEDEFELGKIKLITLSTETINGWESSCEKIKLLKSENIDKEHYEELRKSFGGKAATSITVEAELERAVEIAIEETEKSISILRLFSKANVSPSFISCCTIAGEEDIKTVKNLILENDLLIILKAQIRKNYLTDWKIRKEDLELYRKLGLNRFNILIKKESLNDFEKTLLDSLLIYSKHCLMQHTRDKIIYIFSSLEAILLNENENIMQNLSERIAMLIGKSVEEKKLIIKNVKAVYRLRSKFVHTGQMEFNFSEKKDIKQFLENIFLLYFELLFKMDYFKNKEELIEFIEDKKLS